MSFLLLAVILAFILQLAFRSLPSSRGRAHHESPVSRVVPWHGKMPCQVATGQLSSTGGLKWNDYEGGLEDEPPSRLSTWPSMYSLRNDVRIEAPVQITGGPGRLPGSVRSSMLLFLAPA